MFSASAIVATAGRQHNILYGSLAVAHLESLPADTVLEKYRVFPKHHQMMHLLEEEALYNGNPMPFWCYADEREIGLAVEAKGAGSKDALA